MIVNRFSDFVDLALNVSLLFFLVCVIFLWAIIGLSSLALFRCLLFSKDLPSSGRIDTAIWTHDLDANKTAGEKAKQQLQQNAASNIEQVLEATPHKAPTIRPPASHHENYPS